MQSGLRNLFTPHIDPSTRMPQCDKARVIGPKRANGRYDVALLTGGILRDVPVMTGVAGPDFGSFNLPEPSNLFHIDSPDGRIDSPEASGQTDIICIIGYLQNTATQPFIMGFLPPQTTQLNFTEDIAVQLHPNGAYSARHNHPDDYAPDDRIYFQAVMPDLSYIMVGGRDAPIDITPLSAAKNWKPKGGDVRKVALGHGPTNTQLVIEQSGLITIKHILSGMVLTVDPSTQALKITGAQAVEIDAVKTVKLSSTEAITIASPIINLNGAVSVNGVPLDVP